MGHQLIFCKICIGQVNDKSMIARQSLFFSHLAYQIICFYLPKNEKSYENQTAQQIIEDYDNFVDFNISCIL